MNDSLQRAIQLHQAGQLAEAEEEYRRVLASEPQNPDATHFLGALLDAQGKRQEALALLQRAVMLRPDAPHYYTNLADALRRSGQLDAALAAGKRALALGANPAIAHYRIGLIQAAAGDIAYAVGSQQRALSNNPRFVEAHYALGSLFQQMRKLDDARDAYRRALAIDPRHVPTLNELGNLLRNRADVDGAIDCYRQAVAINRDPLAWSNLLYTLPFSPDYDDAAILREHLAWAEAVAKPFAERHRLPQAPSAPAGRPGDRLRIGYVSPDFRQHPVGTHLLSVLEHHDRTRFEIFCYSSVAAEDEITTQCRRHADHWKQATNMRDDELARMIQADRIDVLVDCTLHMAGSRLPVFALKPAPVQITYFGYPGTTGLREVDYRISDVHIDPPGNAAHYAEKTLHLADAFWRYRSHPQAPAVTPPPVHSRGFITLACLNHFAKVSHKTLQLWIEVLSTVPGSRLLLLSDPGSHQDKLRNAFASRGISPDRIAFATKRPHVEYLRLYNEVDVSLDTFPYNGHTTSLDSIYMGVPVISLAGEEAVSRAGLCICRNLNLPDLVSNSPARYVETARTLAADLPRLSELRASLRQRLLSSPLADAPGLARALETFYIAAVSDAGPTRSSISRTE